MSGGVGRRRRRRGRYGRLSRGPGEQFFHPGSQGGGVDRFADVFVTAGAHGAIAVFLHGAGGKGDDFNGVSPGILFDLPGHLQTIHSGQLDVGQDELGPVVGQHLQGILRGFRGTDFIACVGQQKAHQFQVHRCVVYNKNWCSSHVKSMLSDRLHRKA